MINIIVPEVVDGAGVGVEGVVVEQGRQGGHHQGGQPLHEPQEAEHLA